MSRRRLIGLTAASAALGLLIALAAGPRPPSLAAVPAASDTGDPALAARVREVFGDGRGHRAVAVALVEPGGPTRFAGVGTSGDPQRPVVDERTRFEIGSVTKGLTGLLLAEQAARGEVALDEAVVGGASLEDLATHTSGLPRLPWRSVVASLPTGLTGADPYRGGTAEVLALASAEQPPGGAAAEYSNIGAAAAGQVLAERAGTGYPALLAERVLEPLGMSSTTVATGEQELPVPRATGSAASGAGRDPWLAEGWAPAGIGVWSTTGDLALLVEALAAGTAPGQGAATPRARYDDERIGLFWVTSQVDGERVTWHDGGTGGASSFVGFAPGTGRGVVVLGATSADVDDQALELLLGPEP